VGATSLSVIGFNGNTENIASRIVRLVDKVIFTGLQVQYDPQPVGLCVQMGPYPQNHPTADGDLMRAVPPGNIFDVDKHPWPFAFKISQFRPVEAAELNTYPLDRVADNFGMDFYDPDIFCR